MDLSDFDFSSFQKELDPLASVSLSEFKRITKFHALFHLLFMGLVALELLSLIFFFSFFAKSALLAIVIASLFLTLFSYFVLLFYFQAKKPEQLLQLKERFLGSCIERISPEFGLPAQHQLVAFSAFHLAGTLKNQEYHYYPLPATLASLAPLARKLSGRTFWKEVLKAKETMLFVAIDQQLALVKMTPLDLNAHLALSRAYVALSQLYQAPTSSDEETPEESNWMASAYASADMQQKFTASLERAIEELKIVSHFSPEEGWIYEQLALLYKELDLIDEEIRALQLFLQYSPRDTEAMLRLGLLSFQKGEAARGLQLYAELKEWDAEKATALISHYDAYFARTF